MPEVELKNMRYVLVEYTCDECGKGVMRSTGSALMSYPAQYPHECTECGTKKTFRGKKYPRSVWREIKDD